MGAHGNLIGTLEEAAEEIQAAGGKAAGVAADLSDAAARSDRVERAGDCVPRTLCARTKLEIAPGISTVARLSVDPAVP